MLDGSGVPCATGLLRLVYWHRWGEVGVEGPPRRYVYKEDLTRDEASEESARLDRSLNSPY